MVFDLDPDPIVGFSAVKTAALEIRQRLREQAETFVKCTGGRGLVPLSLTRGWDEVKGWASALAHEGLKRRRKDLSQP